MKQQADAGPVAGDEFGSDAEMQAYLGYNLKRAYLVIRRNAISALQKFDLKVRSFTALSLIVANPGITPSRLADLLQIERSNMVLIIDELETLELISRDRDPKDRRRYALNPTIRGRRLLEKAADAALKEDRRTVANLTDEEVDQLNSLLRRIGESG